MSTSSENEQTSTASKATWARDRWHDSIGLRQLEIAAQLQKLRRQDRLNRRLVKKTQDGTIGRRTSEPGDAMSEDDSIQLGDNHINHYGFARNANWLVPAAALLLGGGLTWAAASFLTSRAPDDDKDTNTQYRIRFVQPAEELKQ